MWHYASRSKAFRPEVSAPLPELIEALAPLGMPDVRRTSTSRYGGWVTRICTTPQLVRVRAIVMNVAVVMVIHLAAIKYVFLPIGTV